MEKLLLIDGNSMLFRAFYATAYGQRMTTKNGIPTNAVYGFAMMVQKAIDLIQPKAILVAFDAGKHTFRHELYKEYKGGRKETPEDLVPQFQMVRDFLTAYNITYKEMADIEADDIIGTMSLQYPDYAINILSSDHDLLQLIDPTTSVWLMKKGLTDYEEMTEERLQETMGIIPSQIIDLKGLMGDSSDNIPGIPGVGEKTALKLLSEYQTVEGLYEHVEDLKGKLKEKVEQNKDSAYMSKQLATIKRDVPLDITVEDCFFTPNYSTLVTFLESLNMNSLVKKYESFLTTNSTQEVAERKNEVVKEIPASMLKEKVAIVLDASIENYMEAVVYGLAMSDGNHSYYISLEDAVKDASLVSFLKTDVEKIGYDCKRSWHLLKRTSLEIHYTYDTMIATSLCDSTLTSYGKIKEKYGLFEPLSEEDVYGKQDKPKLPSFDEEVEYSCNYAFNLISLYNETLPSLQEEDLMDLFQHVEMPLTKILFDMEEEGIVCDIQVLDTIAKDMSVRLSALTKSIYEEAGREFNINSPKQLGEVLFDDLGLPSGKKRSTSVDVLEKLVGVHPIISFLMEYRKLQKIYSTYAEGLKKYISRDGKIHTIYNQCATQTGRLSSSEPNLQNISVRDEEGKIIRKAFLPSENHILISSDYSQVELRVLASMANEKGMIDAFCSDIDIHTKTAMDIFGVSKEEVDSHMRRSAKAVNFGIVYGISDFGLATQLGISRKDAQQYIQMYLQKYPRIQEYMKEVVEQCDKTGYALTLLKRRRQIPEIHDKNHMVKEFGKRAAMNAPIQGTAADLIKLAMIKVDALMKEKNVKSKMILQVHDELIFDVVKDEVEEMKGIIKEGMENAMKLSVPLLSDINEGTSWYDAK